MTIVDDAHTNGGEPPRRPRWFAPAVIGVVIGGLIGAIVLPSATAAPQTTVAATVPPVHSSTPAPSRWWASPRDAVLTLADVPPGARIDEEGDPKFLDVLVLRKQYVEGWYRAFTRADSAGASSVWSDLVVYENADAAGQAMLQTVESRTRGGFAPIPLGRSIGDESYLLKRDLGGAMQFEVIFRVANLSNEVVVTGTNGAVDVAGAVDLATKQLARLSPPAPVGP